MDTKLIIIIFTIISSTFLLFFIILRAKFIKIKIPKKADILIKF